jgi:hypothetical protein
MTAAVTIIASTERCPPPAAIVATVSIVFQSLTTMTALQGVGTLVITIFSSRGCSSGSSSSERFTGQDGVTSRLMSINPGPRLCATPLRGARSLTMGEWEGEGRHHNYAVTIKPMVWSWGNGQLRLPQRQ